ncbi:hypothetical protein M409DRAFT_64720 [Zasmidium cellare ATCC 36951]|uniref:RNA helicase n=1 Tax=Zasmidium cellare ATCC 36951 TaxID=1080233 RepID=A0A6A6CQT3_ZASCE|nr:uncharacterized protein M409DRAFT_64720 [Zasmidium cellare ATCC 36951]KAF2169657.1 hypothetical protein M409DRAFT_64720 [Zasmidium cellare ATCC 36951]
MENKSPNNAHDSKKRKRVDGAQNPRSQVQSQSPLAVKKQKLLQSRQNLPIWSRQRDIRNRLREHDILVLSGETGSGKSTQLPQFLLAESWCTGKIAVTQPRRVAAISLARRVAEEMGSPLGSSSPASKVGYSVRFDDNTSPGTKIKYLTEGMLLQEMLRDGTLSQYSCVVVDEVHERSVDVDLLLGFLKQLLESGKRRKPLKIVVMSATADVESLSEFFSTPMTKPEVSGDTSNGTVHGDDEEFNGFSDSEQPTPVEKKQVSTCRVEGRQYPVKLHYLDNPTEDVVDAALQRILHLHCKEPMPGDILVFMTGQEIIQGLQKLVEELAGNLPSEYPRLLVLPLFAALPQAAQQRIFERAPPNTRKVILSTNIAETSVTVPGVRYVVDTGKAKIKQYRNRLGLESLLVKPISKSSADQRKGRAGREAAGQCFRLYTQQSYGELEKDTKPEILRCDLSNAVLKMKARGVEDVLSFPFLTPPNREAMEKALLQLLLLGTLNEDGKINDIGRKVARLPLTPTLGRIVLEAARPERDCLLEVIDIIACLSVENIFQPTDTEEAREKALEARSQLHRRQGDHLTLLAAVQAYASETSDRKRWATDHLISHRAMQNVMNVRKQLIAQCKPLSPNPTIRSTTDEATQENILKCFLKGYHSNNIARLCPDKTYKTFAGNQTVAIHPSSVLFGRKVEAVIYNEFVFTTKAYARGVSAIQLKWLEDVWGSS